MKRIEPQRYFERIIRKFDLKPLNKLDEEIINQQRREYDRRVEVAKLFIPEFGKIGPYDIRYDLAATIVLILAPFDQRQQIVKYISEHYKILMFSPWNIECIKDFYEKSEFFYHPALIIYLFVNPRLPINRFEDFSEFLNALLIFKDQPFGIEQIFDLSFYYGSKTKKMQISPVEIEIVNSIIPYYSHNVEEINIMLKNLYNKGSTFLNAPKHMKELIDKVKRDYKTVKKYLDNLKIQKYLHNVLWVDPHFYDSETLLFFIPGDLKLSIKSQLIFRLYSLKFFDQSKFLFSLSIPRKYVKTFTNYVQKSLGSSIEIYKTFSIPTFNYNFKFLNKKARAFVIDWKKVKKDFKNIELIDSEDKYTPYRAPKGEIDSLTLKIGEYLAGNTDISNKFLQEQLNVSLQKITTRRRTLEANGLRFPYVMNLNCPEQYFLKADISKICELNYLMESLSIFPSVIYSWCENLNNPNDTFMLNILQLPIGSYLIFQSLSEINIPISYELYYGKMVTYPAGYRKWELFDDEENDYIIDLNEFRIITK